MDMKLTLDILPSPLQSVLINFQMRFSEYEAHLGLWIISPPLPACQNHLLFVPIYFNQRRFQLEMISIIMKRLIDIKIGVFHG